VPGRIVICLAPSVGLVSELGAAQLGLVNIKPPQA